jgi:hypothetical protein
MVKVIAFNLVGDGPSSVIGGEAVHAVVPSAPVNITRND